MNNLIIKSSPDHDIQLLCEQELLRGENTRKLFYHLDHNKLSTHKKPICHISKYVYDCKIRGVYSIWRSKSPLDTTRDYLYVGAVLGNSDIIGRIRVFIQVLIANNGPHITHKAAEKIKTEYGLSQAKSMIDSGEFYMSFISEEFINSLYDNDSRPFMLRSQEIETILIRGLQSKFNSNRKQIITRGTGRTPTTNTICEFYE